jgi:hypothetical protein
MRGNGCTPEYGKVKMKKCTIPHLWCNHLQTVEIDGLKRYFCDLKGACMNEKELALKIITENLPKFAIFRVKVFGIPVKISIPINDVIDFLKGSIKK